jgi:hypothetical protein
MDWDWDDVDPCPREAEVGFAGVCEPEPEIPGALGPAGGLREGAKEGVQKDQGSPMRPSASVRVPKTREKVEDEGWGAELRGTS